jgi:hypothetical protein
MLNPDTLADDKACGQRTAMTSKLYIKLAEVSLRPLLKFVCVIRTDVSVFHFKTQHILGYYELVTSRFFKCYYNNSRVLLIAHSLPVILKKMFKTGVNNIFRALAKLKYFIHLPN